MRLAGVACQVFAFEREYVDDDPTVALDWISLGTVRHGYYFRRLPVLLRAVRLIRNAARDCKVVYAFGLDQLLVAYLTTIGRKGRPTVAYEVGDIRAVLLSRSASGYLARALERFLIMRTDVLVVTSDAYFSEYYSKFLKPRRLPRCLVVENKLDADLLPARTGAREPSASDNDGRIRIGYFGLLRCPRSWTILTELASRHPDRFHVTFRGLHMVPAELVAEAAKRPNVEIHGPYRSPSDLDELYGSVDLVWAAYPWEPREVANARWARTNRFYEACYYQRPMIVERRGRDACAVEHYGIGLAVDLSSTDGAVSELSALAARDLQRFRANLESLPTHVYMYTNEHERLLQELHLAKP